MARFSFAMILIVAVLLRSSAAQTTHIVGDDLGWIVPPGGPIAYSTWAATQTFTVGDILVFNFNASQQDVGQVTADDFENCTTTNPIAVKTTSPANFTLSTAGNYYFIGTKDRHCFLGQKLTITVTAAPASSPTASPSPQATPAPASPRAPVTYIVGDDLGWLVPPGGNIAYKTWASDKTFLVGDVLEFNFDNATQDVAVVTQAAYNSCNTTTPIAVYTTSPTKVTISATGNYYFTSTKSRHCALGQQLSIEVSGSASGTPAPSSPPATTTPPSPAVPSGPATYIVGDDLGWLVPPGGAIAYVTWAKDKTFYVGDILVFNFKNGTQDVATLTKAAFDVCNTNTTLTVASTSPARITLDSTSTKYFTSTYARHCALGQQLVINVTAIAATSPTSSATPTPSTTAKSPSSAVSPSSSQGPIAGGPTSNSAPRPIIAGLVITIFSMTIALVH